MLDNHLEAVPQDDFPAYDEFSRQIFEKEYNRAMMKTQKLS